MQLFPSQKGKLLVSLLPFLLDSSPFQYLTSLLHNFTVWRTMSKLADTIPLFPLRKWSPLPIPSSCTLTWTALNTERGKRGKRNVPLFKETHQTSSLSLLRTLTVQSQRHFPESKPHWIEHSRIESRPVEDYCLSLKIRSLPESSRDGMSYPSVPFRSDYFIPMWDI